MIKGGNFHSLFGTPPILDSPMFLPEAIDCLTFANQKDVIAERALGAYLGALGISECQVVPDNVVELFRNKSGVV